MKPDVDPATNLGLVEMLATFQAARMAFETAAEQLCTTLRPTIEALTEWYNTLPQEVRDAVAVQAITLPQDVAEVIKGDWGARIVVGDRCLITDEDGVYLVTKNALRVGIKLLYRGPDEQKAVAALVSG